MADTETKVVHGTGGSRFHRFRLARKRLVTAILALVVLILIAGGTIWYIAHKGAKKSAAASVAAKTMPSADQHTFTDVEKVNGYIIAKQYDQALKLLDSEPSTHDTDGQRATVYYSQGNFQKALDTYKAIDAKYGLRASEARYAGLSAEALHQYQTAHGYYQEAKDIDAKSSDPLKDSNVQEDQSYIDAVSKKL